MFNGAELNDVDWFVDSDNTIEVTQDAYGTTRLYGKVFGESICSTGLYEITKEAAYDNSQPAEVGDLIEYSIKVKNVGNENVFDIVVVDPLLGGELSGYVESGTTDGILNIGETWTYTENYPITAEDIASQGVYNLATVFGKDSNGNPIPTEKSVDPTAPGGSRNPDCPTCTFTAITADCDLIFLIVSEDTFYWAYNYSTYKGRQAPETNSGTIVGTNEGFAFDIYRLDNSFNMIINNVKLYDDEIQFDAKLNPGVNIEFLDGGEYGKNSIPRILSLRGNQEKPMVRVEVSADGTVKLFGSKTSYGDLIELTPKTGSFNNIPWNTDPNQLNNITVSQEVWWKTVFDGYGYGVQDDCNNGKPGGDIYGNADKINMVKYYPNPVNNTLNVQANTTIQEIEIYNLLGQRVIVLRPNTSATEINMADLQAAVYMMKVTMNGNVEIYRVIKQ